MRFERLDLLRFGKFTERQVEFPSGGLDFHVIVGPNEAGKSTIRAAITDLLFGIETQSSYNFIHAYPEMRLGALLSSENERLTFNRLKRTKSPLRDADDNPLKDDLLAPFLGGMDRLAFERMFCLDHAGLLQGGAEILDARDDIARLLFETSSGITGFGKLRDALEAEAKTLWDKRRSGERLYYKAADELQEAEEALKQVSVRARDWVELQQRMDEARQALSVAQRRHTELETERTRLERIRRVAPHLQKLREDLQAQQALSDAIRLPKNAQEELQRASQETAAANALFAQARQSKERTALRQGEIRIEEAYLTLASRIRALAEQRVQTQRYERDIMARRAELELKREQARYIARQLGWEEQEADFQQLIPAQTLRAAIQGQLQDYGRLAEALSSASEAVDDKEKEIEVLRAQLTPLNEESLAPQLSAALETARNLGEPQIRIEEMRARRQQQQERIERNLRKLPPWTGSATELAQLAIPLDAQVSAHQAREQHLLTRWELACGQLKKARDDLAALQLKESQLQASAGAIAHQDVQQARERRDALWDRIRDHHESLATGAAQFESYLSEADRLADLRFGNATGAAAIEHLRADIAQLKLNAAQQERTVADFAAELEAHRALWQEHLRALGLPQMTVARFLDWREQARSVLVLSEDLAKTDSELAQLLGVVAQATQALQRALASCGARAIAAGFEEKSSAELAELIVCARSVCRGIEERQIQRASLLQRQQDTQLALSTLRTRAERAQTELHHWQISWKCAIEAARLPQGTSRLAASQALDLFSALASYLKEIRQLLQERIEPMQRELDAFAAAAHALAQELAPPLAKLPAQQIAQELEQRLASALRDAERLKSLQEELERDESQMDQALRAREQAQARIRPLMEQCATMDLNELRRAIERSDRLYEAEESLKQSRRSCLEHGDGLAIEQLQAQVAGVNVAAVPAQIAGIALELAQLNEEQAVHMQVIAEKAAELKRYSGDADAAAAEARRHESLASMANAIERYVKVIIAARLLRWSIDRYREEKQGPLLNRASQLFCILTCGSFNRLTVDFEGQTPRLKGCRSTGKLIDVEDMSDGTRDQLFLALRLAALELQLQQGRALPFIADDLFINFDDERAAAGLEALAELATHTQVIFLTHHSHLIPIVEKTLGKPINVTLL